MIASWMLYLLAVGGLLAVAARALDAAARRARRATRWIWAGALATLVLLAVIAPRPATTNLLLPRAREAASAVVIPKSTSPSLLATLAAMRTAAGRLVTNGLLAYASLRILLPKTASTSSDTPRVRIRVPHLDLWGGGRS